MKDVALLAGVSTATVSHVINGTRYVSPEVREQVEKAIYAARYSINSTARTLRTQSSRILGVVIWDELNSYYHEVLYWMNRYAVQAGYDILVTYARPEAESETGAIERLVSRGVDGLILYINSESAAIRDYVASLPLPFVLMNRNFHLDRGLVVANDDYGGATLALEHLLEMGHRRIGMMTFDVEETNYFSERLKAWRTVLGSRGMTPDPRYVYFCQNVESDGIDTLQTLMALDEPPTALFCASDQMAFEACSAAHQMGLRIPEELSLVGFDNLILSRYLTPPLSTVAQDMPRLASEAVGGLVGMIGGSRIPGAPVLIPATFVSRNSVSRIS